MKGNKVGAVRTAEAYFDGDDVARFPESHFENLPTGPTADLPLADQVGHLGWIPLHKRGCTDNGKRLYSTQIRQFLTL